MFHVFVLMLSYVCDFYVHIHTFNLLKVIGTFREVIAHSP